MGDKLQNPFPNHSPTALLSPAVVDRMALPWTDRTSDAMYRECTKSTRSSRSASSASSFVCQFHPSAVPGHSLVLLFDSYGHSTFVELSRSDVLALVANNSKQQHQMEPTKAPIVDVQCVHARDLRKLDNAFAVSNEPSIVLRRQAILVNADPVRAVIMRSSCLVFVPDGADSLLSLLRAKFQEALRPDNDGPYEFQATEALLATLAQYYEDEYQQHAPEITKTLDRLCHGNISAGELETLRQFKNTMDEFESQVDGVRRMLMELLDNDEDLHLLYLTKLYQDPSLLQNLNSFDSEEAEVVLENYLQDIFSTRTKATLLQHRIQNTESLVMIKLDWTRNYLLKVDIFLALMSVSLALGTYTTGAFGMNLTSGVEEASGWFWTVFAGTASVCVLSCAGGVSYFRWKGVFH
ncbi:TPA: hypothetical protein N0F65_011194 [Lagenidium giganteum]|uniref:Magnesium transporter n=1 Tax=Lagenidium giganteum TaxID=4803 RepID=A0AAV2Z9M9_9STRA|nr:TPA: hypothetical protein N0F65_011194 [Lagenidium giganteum]